MLDLDTHYCELLGLIVEKAACNIYFLKTIKYIEAPKYFFCINGLIVKSS